MRASQLRTPIEIEERVREKDAHGQAEDKWVTRIRAFANVRVQSGAEANRTQIETSQMRASVRMRYMPNIKAGMRIRYYGGYLQINSVNPDIDRMEYVDLVCIGVNGES